MQDRVRWVPSRWMGAALLVWLCGMPALASHYHRGPTSSHTHKTKQSGAGHHRLERSSERASSAGRPRAIDDARATEIQAALVKAGYLQENSGKWNTSSADAMRKLQSDNGWQTKIIPDSRALIKLGLGPGSEASPTGTAAPSGVTVPMASATAARSAGSHGQQ